MQASVPHYVRNSSNLSFQRCLSSRDAAELFCAVRGEPDDYIVPVKCSRSSHLSGHCADGGGVQAHSAGGLYPWVIQIRETGHGRRWELTGPGIEGALSFEAYDDLIDAGERIVAVATNDDAWAFELEQLMHVAHQRQRAMSAAADRIPGPSAWSIMSRGQRVASLLRLGAVRNTLKLPMTQRPTFAAIASHA